MRTAYLFTLLFLLSFGNTFSQWQNIFTSSNINTLTTAAGWLKFDKDGDTWKSRMYFLDSTKFQIMEEGYSNTPAYTYNFSAGEILAGMQIYSLGVDLNGDNKTEFYVLSYAGPASLYRQSFKIFDITTNTTIFEKNETNFYYSYPQVWDMDGDGILECLVTKFDYPSFANYSFEVYKSPTVGAPGENMPATFRLMQNFPNPFNPGTTISFSLSQKENVQLQIFDVKGELIKTLVNTEMRDGLHEVSWDGSNDKGLKQPTGVYFYQLISGSKRESKKMVLLK